MRKTVAVADLKERANRMLAASADAEDEMGAVPAHRRNDWTADWLEQAAGVRIGVAFLIEQVLMDTGNYRGFKCTDGANGQVDRTRKEFY